MGAIMDEIKYNFRSVRSDKSRISISINHGWLVFLPILSVVLVLAGLMLLAVESPFGWGLVGISIIPAMIVEWYNGELKHLPVTTNPKNIDDVLSSTVLGRLSYRPTPREVASIISKLPGGQFLAVRFGVGSQFLQILTSEDTSDMQKVWQEAWKLRDQTGSKNISAVVLAVALIKCAPNYQSLLSHLQLDIEDLIYGINWYNHLRDLIDQHRTPRRTGGLARDWSFGWTPLLSRFGQNISQQVGSNEALLLNLVAHSDSLDQLINIFGKNGRQNAVLVGASGVGKTEIVNAFASKIIGNNPGIPSSLKYRQVFVLDSSALIAAAPGR